MVKALDFFHVKPAHYVALWHNLAVYISNNFVFSFLFFFFLFFFFASFSLCFRD